MGMAYIETSAKDASNVFDAFVTIARELIAAKFSRHFVFLLSLSFVFVYCCLPYVCGVRVLNACLFFCYFFDYLLK